jgi:hypothetical protein
LKIALRNRLPAVLKKLPDRQAIFLQRI